MPKHHIEITLPTKPLKNVDTKIEIWSDDGKLGKLHISQGSIDWTPSPKERPLRLPWEQFAELMKQEWKKQYGD